MRVTIPCSVLSKLLLRLMLCLSGSLAFQSAHAQLKFDVGLSGGLRTDELAWTIAGDKTGNNPNFLSELIWSDVLIAQTKVHSDVVFKEKFLIRGSAVYGEVFDGDNDDFDFNGDDRTQLFSWSHNKAGGHVADLKLGFGPRFMGVDESNSFPWIISWLAGYSHHEQSMRMTNGYQVYPATGAFNEVLDSTYNATWKGAWLGADVWLKMSQKLALTLAFEYHLADYTANANWNLRDEFAHPVSYEHFAKGSGIFWSFGANYQVSQPLRLAAMFEQYNFSTKAGLDRTYFIENPITGTPQNFSVETQLNGVQWESTALMLQAVYSIR